MIRAITYLQAWCLTLSPDDPADDADAVSDDRGQATNEYELVMVGASAGCSIG